MLSEEQIEKRRQRFFKNDHTILTEKPSPEREAAVWRDIFDQAVQLPETLERLEEARGIIKEAKQEILDACDRDDFMPDETAEFLRELEAFLEDTDA